MNFLMQTLSTKSILRFQVSDKIYKVLKGMVLVIGVDNENHARLGLYLGKS